MTPQIIFLVLLLGSAYFNIQNNFQTKPSKSEWINNNRWFPWTVAKLLMLALLYWGGFFNVFFK